MKPLFLAVVGNIENNLFDRINFGLFYLYVFYTIYIEGNVPKMISQEICFMAYKLSKIQEAPGPSRSLILPLCGPQVCAP
jgi:hypothetical protein